MKESLSKLLSIINRLLPIIGILIIAFIISGGIYLIIMGPSTGIIVKSITSQTIMEFFVSFLLICLSSIGFILFESAMKKTFDISSAKIKFLIAALILITSLILMEVLLWLKIH
ncbi:MAG: hypothetical protein QXW62_05275 [Candidatus Methanomethylicaceae archaeon]